MRGGRRIAIVIPALDEERVIAQVLGAVPDWVDRVVVVDNGSTDRTAAIAASCGARVVRESTRGYGAACARGVDSLVGFLGPADVVAFLDADGSDDPREVEWLVDPVLRGDADLAVGRRDTRGRMRFHQRLGTGFVCLLLRAGFRAPVHDLGPFRAIRFGPLLRLGMRDRAFGWTAEMQARALRAGMRVVEVSVSWRRGEGPSKISGTLRGTLRAGRDLTRHTVAQLVGNAWDRARSASRRRARSAWPSTGA